MGHQCILNILLSLGIFDAEVDMKIHITLRNAIIYAKIVGKYDY